jgi:hypothetical protein
MPSEDQGRLPVLPGTLDLTVLRTQYTMGPRHAYVIATRLQQEIVKVCLNLDNALVRLYQAVDPEKYRSDPQSI